MKNICFFRAFGDKSGPPTLPYADSEGQGLNGEEYEVNEDEEVEECVEEEQSPAEVVIDQICSGTEELNMMEQEEEKGEKGNEQEEEEDDERTPQGNRLSHTSYLSNFKQVFGKCKY